MTDMLTPEEQAISRGNREHFERRYSAEPEPYEYSIKGADRLRQHEIALMVRRLRPARVLDIGCSLGQLTGQLRQPGCTVVAIDLSPTAVTRARELVNKDDGLPVAEFAAAGALSLPFADGSFDVVIASDGLYSWRLNDLECRTVIAEAARVLHPHGFVVLSEHLRPKQFDRFIALANEGMLRVRVVEYLYDALWYRFASWFGAVKNLGPVRAMLGSVRVAGALKAISRPLGRRASRHVVVIAERK